MCKLFLRQLRGLSAPSQVGRKYLPDFHSPGGHGLVGYSTTEYSRQSAVGWTLTSSPLPRRSEPPDRWVLVGLIPCSTVSVHSSHVGQDWSDGGIQFQGRSSSRRLTGWPLVMRSSTSFR